mmetsp:Transcript_32965/g.37788  ORF Transcript_32965/g.37788 Transcript_32965/m.37788 type:complete len:214 (-) Transcript_32965:79-720(-)
MTASAACGESIIDAFGVKEMFRCGMSLSDVNEYMKEEEDDTFLLPEQHRHHLKALLAEEDNENDGGRARRRLSLGGGGAAASSNDILSMSRDSKNSISDVILFDNEGNFGRRDRGHHESQNGLVAYQRGGGGESSSNKSNSSSPLTVPQYSQSTSALRKQRKRLERRAEQQFNQPQHNATWKSNGKVARRNNSSADLLSLSSTMKYNADGSYK